MKLFLLLVGAAIVSVIIGVGLNTSVAAKAVGASAGSYGPGWILMAVLGGVSNHFKRPIHSSVQYATIGILGIVLTIFAAKGSDDGLTTRSLAELWHVFLVGGLLILHSAAPHLCISAIGVFWSIPRGLKRFCQRSKFLPSNWLFALLIMLLTLAFLFPPADERVYDSRGQRAGSSRIYSAGFVPIFNIGGDVFIRYPQWIVELAFLGGCALWASLRRRNTSETTQRIQSLPDKEE